MDSLTARAALEELTWLDTSYIKNDFQRGEGFPYHEGFRVPINGQYCAIAFATELQVTALKAVFCLQHWKKLKFFLVDDLSSCYGAIDAWVRQSQVSRLQAL